MAPGAGGSFDRSCLSGLLPKGPLLIIPTHRVSALTHPTHALHHINLFPSLKYDYMRLFIWAYV